MHGIRFGRKESEVRYMSIKVGIFGYGNLGRGVENALRQNPDMELVAIFTRRDPVTLTPATKGALVASASSVEDYIGKIDVMINCGGSAKDLPEQTPMLSRMFNVVDSFDTHAKIPVHFANVDAAAREGGKISVISVGWDPGMFSLSRLLGEVILPDGKDYTFWGKGVSQGHSDAVRRIEGVRDARQYTIPVDEAVEAVRRGETPELTTREKHRRECYVVPQDGADLSRIEREIKEMPNYFADYDTAVHFITMEEMKRDHAALPHGGCVIRSGKTGLDGENTHVIEYRLELDSNPEFTASVIVAYARAAFRMQREGFAGCKTVLDVPPSYLSPRSREDLIGMLL